MRTQVAIVLSLTASLAPLARAGEFVRNQDLHFIQDFGAISVVDGRLVIGKSGKCNCVPLATQLRIDNGPYITYDPASKTPAVEMGREVNLKAEWDYVVETLGRGPTLADYKGARPNQKLLRTTEIRVQAKSGTHAGWYIGVDRAAIKAEEEGRSRLPDVSEASPLPKWPLVLVKDRADALVFARRESWTYRGAK